MIVLLLIISVFVATSVWLLRHNRDYSLDTLSKDFIFAVFFGLSTCAIVISLCLILSAHCDTEYFHENKVYHEEVINNMDYNMSFETVKKIIESAESDNERIINNRKHCNSPFIGIYYSKKIAKEELIEIPKLKISTKNEF